MMWRRKFATDVVFTLGLARYSEKNNTDTARDSMDSYEQTFPGVV